MLDNFQKDVCRKALDCYGQRAQIEKSVEEMAELITELMRIPIERTAPDKIITEIADATIMMQQLSILFGESAVEREIQKKILRLQARIDTPPLGERHNVHRKDGHVHLLIHDDYFKD